MEFELLLFSGKTQKEYAYYLIDIISKVLKYNFKSVENHNSVDLCFECMTISIELDDELGLDVIAEDFNFIADTSARIQVFSGFKEPALMLLFKTINEIIKNTEYNLLLIGNGSNLIFKKIDNKYYTSSLSDEYYFEFPFDLLDKKMEVIDN